MTALTIFPLLGGILIGVGVALLGLATVFYHLTKENE